MSEKPTLTPYELKYRGYLQEVNRLFFHPLGLALAVDPEQEPDEEGFFKVQIWDYRDDPEGFFFVDLTDGAARNRAASVALEMQKKKPVRSGACHLDYQENPVRAVQAIGTNLRADSDEDSS